ncbi:V-type ATP synthase subunit C [ANME-1 cluster archaeon GoMg2]|nr:V-type ATP synthase subunit C [ANME-1 cluster archaeon GoMg2]
MSVSNYAYAYARIRARMSELLDERRLKELVDARRDDFMPLLAGSAYKDKLTKEGLTEVNARGIEKALKEELIDQYLMVIRSTDGVISAIFEEILRRLEVKNLKAVIRAKAVGTTEVAMSFPVEGFFGRDISRLADADSMEGVIRRLDDPYKHVLEEALPEYEEGKKLFILENVLDEELFGAIWHKTERLRGADKEIVQKIVGIEFDIANIMTMLRCKSEGIAEEEMRKYLLPYTYAFDYNADAMKDSIAAETVNSAIQLLPASAYKGVLSDTFSSYEEKNSLITFENALRQYFFASVRDTLRGYPINIGMIIGYLYLKEIEIRNLCAIAVCKENDIPAEVTMKIVMM